MRPIDADALKDYIDAQEGRPFIGCTVGEALKIMTDEQPTIQPTALGTNLAEVGTDLISRAQAIDAVNSRKTAEQSSAGIMRNAVVDFCVDIIKKLPPAQPKRGKWLLDRSGAYCCSECMEPCAGYVMMKPRDKFCKMCGAKMEATT